MASAPAFALEPAPSAVVAAAAAAAGDPAAREGEGWQVASTSPFLVRSRAIEGSKVREVWAIGVLDAPALEVQESVLATEDFPRFMPHVKEAVLLGPPGPDGSYFSYARTAPPVVSNRDYALHVFVDSVVGKDGRGEFVSRWVAVPDKVPVRPGVVRIRQNSGRWHVVPLEEGRCLLDYRVTIDPGGSLPGFLADLANTTGVTDVLKAIETEARRRRQEKEKAERAAPAPELQLKGVSLRAQPQGAP
jgi:hypothetical protein